MSSGLACGKRARGGDFGAQSMKTDEMKKFIQDNGTVGAKKALKEIKGVPKREQLCEIFHTFRAGREQIQKGEGFRNFKVSSNNKKAAGAAAGSARWANVENSSSSKKSSVENTVEEMLNKLLAKNQNKRAANKEEMNAEFAKELKSKGLRRVREGGVFVITAKPSVRVKNYQSNNQSNGGNSGNANNNYGNNNVFNRGAKHVNYQNLSRRRNKVVKPKNSGHRFNKKKREYLAQKVKPGTRLARMYRKESSSSSETRERRRRVTKPNSTMMEFPSAGGALSRVPTRSVPYHAAGSRSRATQEQLRLANDEKQRRLNAKKNRFNMNNAERTLFENKVYQEALRDVLAGNVARGPASPARNAAPSRRSPNKKATMRRVFGSSSSTSGRNSSGSNRRTGVRVRLTKKLGRMSARKRPQVNIARAFKTSATTGRLYEQSVSLRKSKAELNALRNKYAKSLAAFAEKVSSASN